MENMLEECTESIAHTPYISQVHVPKTPERESHRNSHGSSHHDTGSHPLFATNRATCMNINATCANVSATCTHIPPANTSTNAELLHMVKKQELAWENAEAAVHKLERRLRFLERSDSTINKGSLNGVQDNATDCVQCLQYPFEVPAAGSIAPAGPYNCIYVSPIYDDRRGVKMYRTHIVDDGTYAFRNRPFMERIRDDEKDLEIKRLKLETQRQDLEMRRLKTDIHKLRSLEFEEDRSIISDKFVDKVNTVRATSSTMSRPRSYHDALQNVVSDLSTSFASSEVSVENSKEPAYGLFVDGQGHCGSHSGTPRGSSLSSRRSLKSVRENLMVGRRDCIAAVPDFEGCVISPNPSNNNFVVQQTISSLLSTMQTSLENLCSNIKLREPRDSDSSKIDSGAMDDELFILKKSLSRLEDICHESGYESFTCEIRNNVMEVDKDSYDGIMQQLARAEFKVIALETSCIEKEKRVEDLETQFHAVSKEREVLLVENYELTRVVQELQGEAEEQGVRITELLNINEELLEISQAEETQLGNFQETKEKLIQRVTHYEDSCTSLESILLEKEKELEELNRRLKAGQIGADSIIFEKFELLGKIQGMQAEADQQKTRINELVSINEELLEFAQGKEDQIACMSKEVDRLHAQCREEPPRVDMPVEAAINEESKPEGQLPEEASI